MTDRLQTAMPWGPAPPEPGTVVSLDEPDPDAACSFEATIEAVRYTLGDKNGISFRILSVIPDDPRHPMTWMGETPPVRPGVKYTATGRIERDKRPKYGTTDTYEWIVRISALTQVIEKSSAAIEAYLSSGAIPHIRGPMAKRIVGVFGEATLDILDRAPWRLAEVPGIKDGDRLDKIIAAWTAQRSIAAILMWLDQRGVKNNQAKRIVERYGAETIAKITENPYQLADDVDGIGFDKADAIAQKIGIGADDPRRDLAAVLHELESVAGKNGHCYVERGDLVRKAADLVSAPVARIGRAVAALIARNEAVAIPLPHGLGAEAVFSWRLASAERDLAARLRALMAAPLGALSGGVIDPNAVDMAIDAFEQRHGLALHEAQRAAVKLAARERVIVITGGPGTGKTLVLAVLLELFAEDDVVLVAPTAKAAQRMETVTGQEASTIHMALGWDPQHQCFAYDELTSIPAGVVICDESSMLDLALARDLANAVGLGRRLFLIGDVDQLPSVGAGAVLRDVIAGGIPTARLSHVFRQAEGSRIVTAAHRINAGKMPVSDEDTGGEFYMIPRPKEPGEHLTGAAAADLVVRAACDRIPKSYGFSLLEGDILVLTPKHQGDAGTIALNELLRARLNPVGPPQLERGDRIYRVGDRVINKRNDYKRGISNGATGTIVDVRKPTDDDDTLLRVRFDKKTVDFNGKQLASLRLAYAISIHAAQGSEAQCVIVVVLREASNMLARNLVYTGVTRGKKLVIVVTDEGAMAIALDKRKNGERQTLLAERLLGIV